MNLQILSIILFLSIFPGLSVNVVGQNPGSYYSLGYQYDKPADGVVRILTYNVRNCVGMDEKTDYNRVAEVIKAIQPDFVALQELDSVTTRSNKVDVLKILAERCGMNYIYGGSIPYRGGKYGVGILSNKTFVSTSFCSLPGREEKRGLLTAEFENLILFCSHFSLTEADRVASVELISKKAARFGKRVFLAGDLNAAPKSEPINLLTKSWINLSGQNPSYPSSAPTECIDYIWGIKGSSYKTIKQEVVPEKTASDHRPVFIDVTF